MHIWRLVAGRHAATALNGEGAALFGGRWNPPGRRMVYTADSLALATVELSVHITGGRVRYVALQLELPDHLVPGGVGPEAILADQRGQHSASR